MNRAVQQTPQNRCQLQDHLPRRIGIETHSDEIEFSVLNKKCGLI